MTAARVVVLLSGGIDSLVCAELARTAGRLAGVVFVDYGHPAQIPEGWKAFAYHGKHGVPLKAIHAFGLDLGDMVATEDPHNARIVPARNAVLLALAANAAASLGAGEVWIGATLSDDAAYPDCRPANLAAYSDGLQAMTGVSVRAPLGSMSKAEVIAIAREHGLRPEDAWSCYGPGPERCGRCASCAEAAGAWA